MAAKKKIPRIVGYSLGTFVAVVALLIFFWVLFTTYDITLVVDSETYITFQGFFNILYFIFVIALGFVAFPPILHFTLEGIYSFRDKKRKAGVLYMLAKNSEKIVYVGTMGYWSLYIFGLSLYFLLFLTR